MSDDKSQSKEEPQNIHRRVEIIRNNAHSESRESEICGLVKLTQKKNFRALF